MRLGGSLIEIDRTFGIQNTINRYAPLCLKVRTKLKNVNFGKVKIRKKNSKRKTLGSEVKNIELYTVIWQIPKCNLHIFRGILKTYKQDLSRTMIHTQAPTKALA